jgi:hypothetical protein
MSVHRAKAHCGCERRDLILTRSAYDARPASRAVTPVRRRHIRREFPVMSWRMMVSCRRRVPAMILAMPIDMHRTKMLTRFRLAHAGL